MIDLLWLAGYGVQGAVTGAVLMLVYVAQSRLKIRAKRVRYAGMLLVEIVRIHFAINSLTLHGSQRDTIDPLPRNVYGGLVSSAELSLFDSPLQMQLHSFYEDVEDGRVNSLKGSIEQMYGDVKAFQSRNTLGRLGRAKDEMVSILDPRRNRDAPDEYKPPKAWWAWFLFFPIVGTGALWMVHATVSGLWLMDLAPYMIVWGMVWWLLFALFAVLGGAVWRRAKDKSMRQAKLVRVVILYIATILFAVAGTVLVVSVP